MRRLVALSIVVGPLFAATSARAYTVETIPVTTGPTNQYDPAVSAGKVAWTDNGVAGGNSDIWVYDIGTKTYTQLLQGTTNVSNQQLADLNGSVVVYTDDRNGTPSNPTTDIFAFNLSTGIETQISHSTGSEFHPRISADGRVVWESDDLTVWSRDPVSGVEARIADNGATLQQHPSISGSVVVWHELGATGTRVRSHDFSTGVTADETGDGCQSPDIDGTTIVYQCTDAAGISQIYSKTLGGTVVTTVTTATGTQQNAHVSGTFVVWEDLTKGPLDSDVLGYDLATKQAMALATTPANEHLNDISGLDVAYTTNAAANDDIVVLHVTLAPTPTTTDPCDSASGAPLLFEETFLRGKGKPVTERRTFTAPTGMVAGTICLDLDRVSAAKVEFDGVDAFVQSDFNPSLTKLQKDVTLTESNDLEVTLFGKPHHGETSTEESHGEGNHGGHHRDAALHGHHQGSDEHENDGDNASEHPAGGAAMHVRVVGPMPAPAACSVASTSGLPGAGALASLLMAGIAVLLPRARRQR